MQIILKSATQFFQREKDKVLNTVTLKPSVNPQIAPDWINLDPMFELMVRDGSLIQIATVEQTEHVAVASAETTAHNRDKTTNE